jgi:pantothenate kinase-related protein Tda10
MKEGYLQLKISELNDKCTQIDQLISMEKSKIELLEQRVGGLKELIKKLQDLDEFKDKILKQVQKDNQKLILEEIKTISDKVTKNIDSLVKSKTKEIEDVLNYMKSREKGIDQQTEMISQVNEKVNYLLNHNNFLMMKLVNKSVLSDREVTELHTRSTKKSD